MTRVGVILVIPFCIVFIGCSSESFKPQELSLEVVIKQEGMEILHEQLTKNVMAAPETLMIEPGLVGALGGARVKLLKTGAQQILLPLPQLADGQVPICYYIHSTPPESATDYSLHKRERENDIVSVRLIGKRDQVVQIEWSSVILVTMEPVLPNFTNPDSYRRQSGCAQSESNPIKNVALELWPANDKVKDYLANIQRYIREMKHTKQPRSLDALGILDSGANGICTANANLALALLRTKGVASRSMAVIPPISQRLEMHRIVEYFLDNRWVSFDPSSLHTDLPMKPWQSIIMAKTTMVDEDLAMKPRLGSMVGCPYGQELELMTTGVTLWGQDFFWTIAKPLATFQPDDELISVATEEWKRYLQEGTLSQGQVNVRSAKYSKEFLQLIKGN